MKCIDLIIGQETTDAVMIEDKIVVNLNFALVNLTAVFNRTLSDRSLPFTLADRYNKSDGLGVFLKYITSI